MSVLPHHLFYAALSAGGVALLACDFTCEDPVDPVGNQDSVSLEMCPPLPPGIEPIGDLLTARASERFDGLTLTLSTRPLACGEPAAQHGYCGEENGLTVGLPAEDSVVGSHRLGGPVYMEFETPDTLSVGGGGSLGEARVELFEITDTCVTGRIIGLASRGGPFDGGFRAPRCSS